MRFNPDAIKEVNTLNHANGLGADPNLEQLAEAMRSLRKQQKKQRKMQETHSKQLEEMQSLQLHTEQLLMELRTEVVSVKQEVATVKQAQNALISQQPITSLGVQECIPFLTGILWSIMGVKLPQLPKYKR